MKHWSTWVGGDKRFGAWKRKWALLLEKLWYEVTLTKISGKQIDLIVFLKYKNYLQAFECVGGREVVSFHQGRQQFLWFLWIAPTDGAICSFRSDFKHRRRPSDTQTFNKFWALLLILVFCLQRKRVSTFQVSSGKTKQFPHPNVNSRPQCRMIQKMKLSSPWLPWAWIRVWEQIPVQVESSCKRINAAFHLSGVFP